MLHKTGMDNSFLRRIQENTKCWTGEITTKKKNDYDCLKFSLHLFSFFLNFYANANFKLAENLLRVKRIIIFFSVVK